MISKELFCEKAGALITEEDRKEFVKCKKRTRILLCTILPSIVVTTVLMSIFISFAFVFVDLVLLGLAAGIICATSNFKWKNFKNKYSKKVLSFLFEDYQFDYNPNYVINKNIFKASKFAGSFDRYTGEDLIKIKIKNDDGSPSEVELSMCDLHVTDTRTRVVVDSKGHAHTETYTVTVYKGAFGYIKFPFSFKCELQLNPYYKQNERIKLEDIDFNKRFKTYTDNQMEALCILTPTMMTKLKILDKSVKELKVSLKKDTLYMGFSRDMFELNKKAKKLDGEVFSRFYDDVKNLYDIVEEIKNNNKVFKM